MTTARRSHAQRQVDAEDRLTQALAELIAEQGYERTTAAQVGERAGYSRAAVRDRYGSKDGLLFAMHARYEALLLGTPESPPASIEEFLGRVADFARERPEWLRAIYVVSFEATGAATPFTPVVRRWVATLRAVAIAMFDGGQRAGTMRADFDPAELADRLLDEAIGHAYRWVLGGGAGDYAAYLATWAQQISADLTP